MAGADAALVANLIAADPTQWESILAHSKSTAFSQYGEDTNWWLLQSSLEQMRTTIPRPAFILITGDLLAHRFPSTYATITHDTNRENYRELVLKTVDFIALEFRKRFPDTRILIAPGNNDEECGNYSVEAGGRFLHDTSDLVRKLAHGDDEVRASWEALGSFDLPHPTLSGVRIVSLNTVFFSDEYRAARFDEGCARVPSTAPHEQLAWLETHLSTAAQKRQKVWLMFHIPPGIDGYSSMAAYQKAAKAQSAPMTEKACVSSIVPMWVPEWTAQFDALLKKYDGTVLLSFAGHTHADDFRLINTAGQHPAFVLINPAISPIYRQNPGFRTVTFAGDGSLLDASVYYLTNLEFASNKTPGEWKREYTFSQKWKDSRIDAAGLGALYDRIVSKQSDRDEWLKLYNISSAAAYVPASAVPGLYCADEALSPEAYRSCFCPAMLNSAAAAARH